MIIRNNYWQYAILFIGLVAGVLIFLLSVLVYWKIFSVIFIGLFYVGWGTAHHILARDWHIKVTLEYLLIAVLACGLLLSIILRG